MIDNKTIILNYLKKHYKETGRDFYFKSKHLNIPLLSNSVKGRILKELANTDEKPVEIWSSLPTSHELTFKTNFKNNGE